MYTTRIVKVGVNYFVEYKWDGSFLSGLLRGADLVWTRYSMVPCKSIKDARKFQSNALRSHKLNYQWNTRVVE